MAGDDGDPTPTAASTAPKSRRSHRAGRAAGVLAGYILVSLWIWRRLVPHLATHTLSGGLLDPGLFIWWMQWTPYALTHGMNPFRTTFVDAPVGVSAMWNTSVPALGVLFAPVTLLSNAVVSFNLACILGPPLSAWTAWLWLSRHVRGAVAMLGGLVFGFSPFVIDESHAGHLQFTWLVLLPVIVMLVEDLLWRSPRPPWRTGALLGLVVAVQLLVSSEALLIVTLGCVAFTALLALTNPRAVWSRLRALVPAGAVAVGVAGALCAWPLYEQFRGDVAIRQPVQPLGSFGGRPGMLVHATYYLAFHSGSGPRGHLTSVENGLYIGWPLLALVTLTAVCLFRRRGVVIAAITAAGAILFQMYGTHWRLAGHSFSTPLHFLQTHVAVTGHILPGRLAIVMWFALAWLLVVALDTAVGRVPRRWAIVPVLIAVLCIVPLLPGPAGRTPHLAVTPALFDTSLRRTIAEGSTIMVAPMATVADDAPELWQVKAGMRFRQLGGYILHSTGPNGAPSYAPEARVLTLLFGIDVRNSHAYEATPTPAILAAARDELVDAHVSMFVVGYSRLGEGRQLALAQLLLGRPPDQRTGGTAIWRLGTDRA